MSEYPSDPGYAAAPEAATADDSAYGVVLTPQGQQYLDQTRPWVRFMSIMTFLGAALMIVVGLVMLAITAFGVSGALGSGESGRAMAPFGAIGGVLLSIVYMAAACFYLLPGLYLWRYSSAIAQLRATASAAQLEEALKHQKSFWRFVGILTAVAIVLSLVGVILAIVVGMIAAVAAGRS